MSQERVEPIEETLDPEDWESMRVLGHRMVDDMLTYLQNVRSKPSDPPTQKAIDDICVPLTQDGEGEEKVYQVFQNSILPYTRSGISPRFWGFVVGTGSPYGMFAEMLRAGMNGFQEGFFAEAYVHKQVISWIKEMIDFPEEAGGVLVNGGSCRRALPISLRSGRERPDFSYTFSFMSILLLKPSSRGFIPGVCRREKRGGPCAIRDSLSPIRSSFVEPDFHSDAISG